MDNRGTIPPWVREAYIKCRYMREVLAVQETKGWPLVVLGTNVILLNGIWDVVIPRAVNDNRLMHEELSRVCSTCGETIDFHVGCLCEGS